GERWRDVPLTTFNVHFESEADDREGVRRELEELAGLPILARVTDLSLWEQGITDAALAALVASPHLVNLRRLDLFFNGVGDKGSQALAASPHLPNLAFLDMGTTNFSSTGLEAVASSPNLPRLVELDLSESEGLPLAVVRALVRGLKARSLRRLEMNACGLGD